MDDNRTPAQKLNDEAGDLLVGGDAEAAIDKALEAIALDPLLAGAHSNLGAAYRKLNRFDNAIVAFERALDIEPNTGLFNSNYADALTHLGRYDEAADFALHAIMLHPNDPLAFNNLAMSFWGLNKLPQAEAAFATAIALKGDIADAHKNRGIILLMLGRYEEGFNEYAWRWASQKTALRPFRAKAWEGRTTPGVLCVWGEQGPGDEILAASMADDVRRMDGIKRLIWECDERLLPLFKRSFPTIEIIPRAWPPQEIEDLSGHVPAISMGTFVRKTPDWCPRDRRSYLVPDPKRVALLLKELNLKPGEKLIGISWKSQNATLGSFKSTQLMDWLPMFQLDNCRFVDLQYGDTTEERSHAPRLEHLAGLDLMNDFDGLAALISLCHTVVTVSNTTAHLAGAIGADTRVLVSNSGGKLWYWGTGQTTPWYSSVQIMRQQEGEHWARTISRVAEDIHNELELPF